ncbi:MAG: arginine--tRNA ligase [Candidatus Asgardarchaeia archaeon]
MILDDPLQYFMDECKIAVEDALKKAFGESLKYTVVIREPKNPKLGDLCTPSSFPLSKVLKRKPEEIAKLIGENIDLQKYPFIKEVNVIGGFVNFTLDAKMVSEKTLRSISYLNEKYGSKMQYSGKKILVEHTSANPIHPLHVGSGRNSVYGDTLARIFSFLGAQVLRHFYVDDVGLQVAITSFGYNLLSRREINIKPDHWIGGIYAITHTLLELNKLNEKVTSLRERINIQSGKLKNLLLEFLLFVRKEQNESLQTIEKVIKPIFDKLSISSEMLSSPITWVYYIDRLTKILDDLQAHLFKKQNQEVLEQYPIGKELLSTVRYHTKMNEGSLKTLLSEIKEINENLEVSRELEMKFPLLFRDLYIKIKGHPDAEKEISNMLILYEQGDNTIKKVIREVANLALEGFKDTLNKLDISFDSFDWESDLIFNGYVDEVIKRLDQSGYLIHEAPPSKALILDLPRACLERRDIREVFGISEKDIENARKKGTLEDLLPPKLVIRRSDGSTLYTTRDIAYTLWKFENLGVDEVYNVIAIEQKLPQKQLIAAMILMGFSDIMKRFHPTHYEMVDLTGFSMSGRKGRYVTMDELYSIAVARARDEIKLLLEERKKLLKKYESFDERSLEKIAIDVAKGAIRFSLINIAPTKRLTFDIELTRALKLEANTAPFLQYSHARACSILREWGKDIPTEVNFSKLNTEIERKLILKLAAFPSVVETAARTLRPDVIAQYAISLALNFSDFYSKLKVLNLEDKELEEARVTLVNAVRIVLRNALQLLGVPALEKM